jgi:hypothetical protein
MNSSSTKMPINNSKFNIKKNNINSILNSKISKPSTTIKWSNMLENCTKRWRSSTKKTTNSDKSWYCHRNSSVKSTPNYNKSSPKCNKFGSLKRDSMKEEDKSSRK